MLRRFAFRLGGLALGLACWLHLPAAVQAQAQDPTRYYYYPYYYFPHNYVPNQIKWPDPKQPFQRPPAYMAYPPYQDPLFRYELFEHKKYYKGFHFWLDQF